MKESSTHNSGNDFSKQLEDKYQNLSFDFGVSDKNENKVLLKAPNGKASNLSAEQYRLVRTPAFKAWFGDWIKAYRTGDYENVSKVLDENGEPKVVFHGTRLDFTVFDKDKVSKNNKWGEGFYFTDNYEYAKGWANSRFSTIKHREPLMVFINVRDIYDIHKSTDRTEYVVKEPTDIKLADGTNTTFDPKNPDIRYEGGGKTETLLAPNEKSNPVKEFFTWYKNWYKPISGKMNIMFSVPNELHLEELLAMMTEENVVVMELFEKTDQNIDAKPFMQQICEKADKLGITIYLEPNPRYKYFTENTEKRNKVNKQYLFDYYSNFGFEPTSDKRFMKRTPNMRFDKGGQTETLLAPNGKPSNLTPEQWHLVRTPEFKNWFGNWENDPENSSKVVDDNGEPLVVWHGGEVRNIFDKSKIGKNDEGWFGYGFYFTEDKSFANSWGESKPYFISIKNPFEIIKKGISLVNPFYNNSIIETDNKIKEGYDGSIFKLSKPNEYVVFYEFANNIKLADGTNTTFDQSNPDIRFKKGGEVDYKQLELERIAAKYQNFDFDLSVSPQKKIRLAPNGKPSKLNEVQYKAVRSANFINWFGDWQKAYKTGDYTNVSRCIDENGEPLIVYRGHSKNESDQYTKVFNYQVNRFSMNRNPNRFAFYFTESYYVANRYGGGDEESIVTPYFLNIREMCNLTPENPEYPNESEFYYPYFDKYNKLWVKSLIKIDSGNVNISNYKDEIPEPVISFFQKTYGLITERNFDSFRILIIKKASYMMNDIVEEYEKYYGSHATLKQVIKMIDPNVPLSIMDSEGENYTNFMEDYFEKNYPVFFFFIHHMSFLYFNLPDNTDIKLKREMVKRGYTGGKFLETTYAEQSPTGSEMVYFNFYPEDVKLADGSNYTFRPDVQRTDFGDGGEIMIYPD